MPPPRYVLALDQGTTGSTALVFDRRRASCARAATPSSRSTIPQPGWVEHDPEEIWAHRRRGRRARALAEARVTGSEIAAIGITNQRETTVVWDRATGEPDPPRDRLAVPPHRRDLRPR